MTKTQTTAILGCGLIGESWAALFLAQGHDVRAWDPARRPARRFPTGSSGPWNSWPRWGGRAQSWEP